MVDFLLSDVYGHGLIVMAIILLMTMVTWFDQGEVIFYGMYVFICWLLIEVVFIVNAEYFWHYIGYLTFTGIITFSVWLLFIYICGKIGKSYHGEGVVAIIVPVTTFPLFIGFSIVIKAIMLLWNFLFN